MTSLIYLPTEREFAAMRAVSVVFDHYAQPQHKEKVAQMIELRLRAEQEDVDPNSAPSAIWKCDLVTDPFYRGPALQFGMIAALYDNGQAEFQLQQLGISQKSGTPEISYVTVPVDDQRQLVLASGMVASPYRQMAARAVNMLKIINGSRQIQTTSRLQ